MNRLGQWRWRIVVVLVLGGLTIGMLCGQPSANRPRVRVQIVGQLVAGTLYRTYDPDTDVVCYGVEGFKPQSFNAVSPEAISCVRLKP